MISTGAKLPKPPSKPEDILAFFQLIASPEGVQEALRLREEWADAHQRNEALLADITQGQDAQSMLREAERVKAGARTELHDARERADEVVADAERKAEEIRRAARAEASRLRDEAEQEKQEAERLRKESQKEAMRVAHQRSEADSAVTEAAAAKRSAEQAEARAEGARKRYEQRLAEIEETLVRLRAGD